MERKILLTDCPDAKGLIAKITNICYKHQLNIIKNDEFVDYEQGRFFMRTELEGRFNDETLLADLDDALPEGSDRRVVPSGRKRLVVLVTNLRDEDDCELLGACKRIARQHRLLITSLREEVLDRLRQQPVQNYQDAIGYCGTLDYLQARDALHERLHRT